MPRGARRAIDGTAFVITVVVSAALAGCQSTVDSLGYDDPSGMVLHPMHGPTSYPNVFGDVLGKSNVEIAAKISDAFDQLFHGDPSTEAIYFPVSGQEQAYIKDIYHGDVRTDGMALGMLIAVELGKQDEFDRLWNYALANLKVTSGVNKGYFLSSCGTTINPDIPCFEPFGQQHMLMALLLAYDRWGPSPGATAMTTTADAGTSAPVDYAAGAAELLTVMRHKVDQNGGIVDGVTDTFDPNTTLVFVQPDVTGANLTSPSIELPGFYDLWAQATGDPFWNRAATAARAYWARLANPTTGLVPARSHFDGTAVAGADTFASDAYRSLVNIVIDRIWTATAPTFSTLSPATSWDTGEADRLLIFFIGADINLYGREFTLGGGTVDASHDEALVAANGTLGLISTEQRRSDFIQAVWDMAVPTGSTRYFTGTMQLLALMLLGGQFQVY